MDGFGLTKNKIQWTKNGKNVPLENLIDCLKQILRDKNKSTIPKMAPLLVPKRLELPKFGQVVMKVQELDEKTINNDVQLIETSNEMFQLDEENVVTSILSSMQPKIKPCLFNLKKERKIEYLFRFVVNGKRDLHWCAGYVIDVSNGEDFSKWRMGTTGCSNKCYKKGEAAKVLWDAVGAHPSETTTVPFGPGKYNRQKEGAWRLYFE